MNKLNYAIIGTNWLSKLYSVAIKEAGENFYAICSRDKIRGEEFARGSAKVFDNIEDMLNDPKIDVVYNCTPNIHHGSISTLCLRMGKHVFCEKPITMTSQEVEEVCKVADEEGKKYAEAIMNFFSPELPVLKKELESSGDVVLARFDFSQRSSKLDDARNGILASTFNKSSGGGVLMDLGPYPLHLAVNLFGVPKAIKASAHWFKEVDITDSLLLQYDGFDLVITISKMGQGYIGSEIICDKATFQFKNISMLLGITKMNVNRERTELLEETSRNINQLNDSELFIKTTTNLIKGFSAMVRGDEDKEYFRLRQQSLEVQKLISEVKQQIGY